MKKVQDLMERRIKEIDTLTYRDVQLIRDTSNNLNELINQTEENIAKYHEAAQRLKNLQAQVENFNISQQNFNNYENLSSLAKNNTNNNTYNSTYIESSNHQDNNFSKTIQTSDDKESDKNKGVEKTANKLPEDSRNQIEFDYSKYVKQQKKVSFDKIPKRQRQSFNDDVRMLFNSGYSVEDIAEQLSCSTTEIQYILDLGL